MLRATLLIWAIASAIVIAQQPRATVPRNPSADRSAPIMSEVLAAQVMLDRSGFSSGEIDGKAGPNFLKALSAFQMSRGLRVSGLLDEETAERLHEDAGDQPAAVTYVLTDIDIAGPFEPNIPKDLVAQSKLKTLSYRNPLEALAEKFHVSPVLLQTLNEGQTFATAGEQVVVPNVELVPVPTLEIAPTTITETTQNTKTTHGARTNQTARNDKEAALPGIRIVVTKQSSALTVEDESGRVLFYAPVTTGSSHDPLPIGVWKVTVVQQMPAFHYNPKLFWDANPSHSDATIRPGPNNPVGVAWIDITKEHYGIHGTPEPSTVGHTQSHGCVRMTNWDVRRVLEWAKPGTPVVFQ
jgi:lipoprotein-anchoring transpeptidase ErfK/SrfK